MGNGSGGRCLLPQGPRKVSVELERQGPLQTTVQRATGGGMHWTWTELFLQRSGGVKLGELELELELLDEMREHESIN